MLQIPNSSSYILISFAFPLQNLRQTWFRMASTIRTRLLILSDTHGKDFDTANRPLHHADVAIHCGDLSDGSKLEERIPYCHQTTQEDQCPPQAGHRGQR